MTRRCCTFCRAPGHTINTCSDSRIEETWKYVLREVDLRLGNSMNDEYMQSAEDMLRTIPTNYLKALGVHYGNTLVGESKETHIENIKNRIKGEAAWFSLLRIDERIEYLRWLDPDSYDFDAIPIEFDEEYPHYLDDIGEDPRDISHFAFFDRTPEPSLIRELENEFMLVDEELEKPARPIIEPMMLCLETAEELSALTECMICMDEKPLIMFDTTNCQHTFCHGCICRHLDSSKNGPTCPACRATVQTLEVKDIDNYDDITKRYMQPLMIYD